MARVYLVFILLVAHLKIGFCLEDISKMSEERIIELLHGSEDMLQPFVDKCSYDYQSEFVQFKEDYYKSYNGLEEERRFNIFRQNMFKVKLLSKIEQGTAKYGVTKFSDLTSAEFLERYTGLLEKNPKDYSHRNEVKPVRSLTAPAELDWRKRGAVTSVKNQGECGVCYIFAVTGNVESQYAIKNHQLLELSEQEVLDCDAYDKGCKGGYVEHSYDSIEQLGGLETEQEYPYEAVKQSKCGRKKEMFKVPIKKYVNLTQNEDDMVQHLATDGPIVVSLNSVYLQHYNHGIIKAPENACNSTKLNHAVLIVGYGEKDLRDEPFIHIPHWIIKNSWGGQWAEEGYFRFYRGMGLCGVDKEPSTAIL